MNWLAVRADQVKTGEIKRDLRKSPKAERRDERGYGVVLNGRDLVEDGHVEGISCSSGSRSGQVKFGPDRVSVKSSRVR